MAFLIRRKKVQVADVKGRFQRLHRLTAIPLYLVFFLTPWIEVGGHPAVQVDLPGRRLWLFGSVFTPRDTFFLVLLGLGLAFGLFFVTALFGRVWCGYACPQSFFLEEWIRPIERWIEGPRGRRIQRDRGPWTWDKTWRKAVKWTLFLVAAGIVGGTFTTWFTGPRPFWTGQAGRGAYGFALALTAFLFLDYTWFREQACNFLCPYARFQGALTDEHSLVISYDRARGEPRGKRGKAKGECIDCKLCVTVCPQGIDIRNGYQLECIACARCVDACTHIMGKFGRPSLVRYVTEAEEEGRKTRWIRGRTVVYAALLVLVGVGMGLTAHRRLPLQANVSRMPGTLFVVDDDGMVRNTWLLEVGWEGRGGSDGPHPVQVQVEGLDGAEVVVPPIALRQDETAKVPLAIRVPADRLPARTVPFQLVLTSGDVALRLDAKFIGDAHREG